MNLTSLHENGADDNLEMTEKQWDIFRIASNETNAISRFPNVESEESIISIASGERQIPMPMLNNDYCEEITHPHLLSNGRFGYEVERDIPLSPSKYFNQSALFGLHSAIFIRFRLYICSFSFITVKLE